MKKKKKIDKERLFSIIIYDIIPLLLMIGGIALVIATLCYYSR